MVLRKMRSLRQILPKSRNLAQPTNGSRSLRFCVCWSHICFFIKSLTFPSRSRILKCQSQRLGESLIYHLPPLQTILTRVISSYKFFKSFTMPGYNHSIFNQLLLQKAYCSYWWVQGIWDMMPETGKENYLNFMFHFVSNKTIFSVSVSSVVQYRVVQQIPRVSFRYSWSVQMYSGIAIRTEVGMVGSSYF